MHYLIISLALLLSTPPAAFTAEGAAENIAMAQIKTATLDVKNMTCRVCLITVEKALQAVPGVLEVQTDWEAKTATVRYDGAKVDVDALTQATAQAGFPSTVRP